MACASLLSRLHNCPTVATHGLKILLSNPTLLDQYIGNRPKMVVLNQLTLLLTSQDISHIPLQCTAATPFHQRMPTRLTWLKVYQHCFLFFNLLYLSKISIAGFNLIFSIVCDARHVFLVVIVVSLCVCLCVTTIVGYLHKYPSIYTNVGYLHKCPGIYTNVGYLHKCPGIYINVHVFTQMWGIYW